MSKRIVVFGEGGHDAATLKQFRAIADRAQHAALMADGHLGYDMPIGGVAAYVDEVSATGVGFDIGCGNAAARLDLRREDIPDWRVPEIATEIFHAFAFGVGGENRHPDAPRDHPVLRDIADAEVSPSLVDKARRQLGTIGGGNHYVDLLTDEEGYVWVGVHFGSRGFGHGIATRSRRLQDKDGLLSLHAPSGKDYWHLMNLAGDYAYAGRDWVVDTVADLLGARQTHNVHNNHNFAWEEEHYGQQFVVVRKGATPAFPAQEGFVGGSMGDISVILAGSDSAAAVPEQERALFSTVHGAGRVLSRTKAKKTIARADMDAWIAERGVRLCGGGLDESPQAYRRLPDVLAAQGPTVEVRHTLHPFVVCMAPPRRRR